MKPHAADEGYVPDLTLQLAREASRKMSLREVQALVEGDDSDAADDDDELDNTASQTFTLNYFLTFLLHMIPGAKAFGSLPTFPLSPIPHSIDYGFTRARHTLYIIMSDPGSKLGVIMFFTVMLAIITSIGSFSVSTFTEYRTRAALGITGDPEAAFDFVESVCISVFTAEYLSRFFTATAVPSEKELLWAEKHGWQSHGNRPCPLSWPTTLPHAWRTAKTSLWKLVAFVLAPLNIIDVIAIAPFYYNLVYPSDVSGNLMIIRVLRLARVFRLARMSKRMEGVQILASTMYTALDALGFLTFFLVLAVVMFGTIIFFCEGGDFDPSTGLFMRPTVLGSNMEPSPFRSIPHSFWWTVVTMTTVGYGDMVPTTNAGRALGSIIMLCGVMVLALPITVVGSAFTEEYAKYKERRLIDLLVEAEKAENDAAEEQESAIRQREGDEQATMLHKPQKEHSSPLSDSQPTATSVSAAQHALSIEASGADEPGVSGSEHAIVDVAHRAQDRQQHEGRQQQQVEGPVSPTGRRKMAALRTKLAALSGTARPRRASVTGGHGRGSPGRTSATENAAHTGLSKTSKRELDLLIAMRGGKARLQAVSAMETAFKTGHMPLLAEATLSGHAYGSSSRNLLKPASMGMSSDALAEVAEHLSAQMREHHAESVESSAAHRSQTRELQDVVMAQAQRMERMREEIAELKQLVLQALQVDSMPPLPGAVEPVRRL